jgi:predicted nucleic acid-binding protein
MIILDTNVLSALMIAERVVIVWLDAKPRTSVWTTAITVMEIRYGLRTMPAGRRRAQRETEFARVLEFDLERRVLPFDHDAAEAAAELMDKRRHAGRLGESRDTMIAGIALAHRGTLATRNVRHFGDLQIPVVDPWHS